MRLLRTLRAILSHPLYRDHKMAALGRFLRWQLGARMLGAPVAVPFTDQARLLVTRGMTGATGNVYCGLHEFPDMAFLLHWLRPNDLFVDVGANVGSYTILAAAVARACCVTFEPIPATFSRLCDNVALNRVQGLVECHNVGVGRTTGTLCFTSTKDTMNHVVVEDGPPRPGVIEVPVSSLDELLGGRCPTLMKIDVEGFEIEVLNGGEQTLRQDSLRAVILETNWSGRRYGFHETALHDRMVSLGFSACDYSPFERVLGPRQQGAHMTDNTLYVRGPASMQERLRNAAPVSVLGKKV